MAVPSALTDEDVLLAAQHDRAALQAVLTCFYPMVCRMSYALSGVHSGGTASVRMVMNRCLHVASRWQSRADANNWFTHHTLLMSRTFEPAKSAQDDPLQIPGDDPPAYQAFIRALRGLPYQQREAFILSHGERLGSRMLGIAMDCSTSAAANHLAAAQQDLKRIAGDELDVLTERLSRIYSALEPREALIVAEVQTRVSRYLTQRSLRRGARAILYLAVATIIAWLLWELHHMIEI